MGLAVSKDIANMRESTDLLPPAANFFSSSSSSASSFTTLEDTSTATAPVDLAFVRFFSKLNNVYPSEGEKKKKKNRVGVWCFVSRYDLAPFSVPLDYYKVSAFPVLT